MKRYRFELKTDDICSRCQSTFIILLHSSSPRTRARVSEVLGEFGFPPFGAETSEFIHARAKRVLNGHGRPFSDARV